MLEIGESLSRREPDSGLDAPGPRLRPEAANDPFPLEPPAIKVLVIEPEPADYAPIEQALRHMLHLEPQIILAATPAAARLAVASDLYDIAIVGYAAGRAGAFDLIQCLGGGPALVVADEVTPAVVREALGQGAAACLARPRLTSAGIEAAICLAIAEWSAGVADDGGVSRGPG